MGEAATRKKGETAPFTVRPLVSAAFALFVLEVRTFLVHEVRRWCPHIVAHYTLPNAVPVLMLHQCAGSGAANLAA